jgi:hypothetical protein
MQDSKYRSVYRERVSSVLTQEGITNLYVIQLIEFLFTRTIWVRRDGVFKAYIDTRAYVCSLLTLPVSLRLILLIKTLMYEQSQINYYKKIYSIKDIRVNDYSLVTVYNLLASVLQEGIHNDIALLLPNSVDDILKGHYQRLYSLLPLKTQQPIIQLLRNPSTSFMLDVRAINKELNIYTDYVINTLVSPLVESNSINLCLSYIGSHIGLSKRGVNRLTQLYNSMILDTYQQNQ